MASREGGSKLGAALVLLLVLGLAGGFNYYRNLQAEEQDQGPRPLAGYDDAGLAALVAAYGSELRVLEQRQAVARSSASGPSDGGYIAENVREFERVQVTSKRVRGLTGEIATREARIKEIEAEQALRSRLHSGGATLHLSRLFGI